MQRSRGSQFGRGVLLRTPFVGPAHGGATPTGLLPDRTPLPDPSSIAQLGAVAPRAQASGASAGWKLHSTLERIDAGEECQLLVEVRNDSDATWRSGDSTPPIRLAYHWYDITGETVLDHGVRSTFTADVVPGTSHLQHMTVFAPASPGEYTLELSVVHERVRWFDGGLRQIVRVEGQPCGVDAERPRSRYSTDPLCSEAEWRSRYAERADPIVARHALQTLEEVRSLQRRYEQPVFGAMRVFPLIERLGMCIDPSDQRLYGASQLLHVLQILDQMEAEGVDSREQLLVALVHDLGKVLLLSDEDPANIVCLNSVVAEAEDGAGLDNCLLQWNHDEFAYQRLKDFLPDDLAWLVRYHSIDIPRVRRLMSGSDLDRTERLLVPFAHFDHATKSPFNVPSVRLSSYRDLIEESFPTPILF